MERRDRLAKPRRRTQAAPSRALSSPRELQRAIRGAIVTLHALRHTHVSQLIASGLDVVTVSRRIGQGNGNWTTDGVMRHPKGSLSSWAAPQTTKASVGTSMERLVFSIQRSERRSRLARAIPKRPPHELRQSRT